MDAYIYNADIYCEECGEAIRTRLTCPGDPDDERSYDSDKYPKGLTGVGKAIAQSIVRNATDR